MEGQQNGSTFQLECPFSEVGCYIILNSSSDYHRHLSNNLKKHLQMIKDFHDYAITGERPLSTESKEDDERKEEASKDIPNASLNKLKAVESEVEFLTDVLSVYGISHLPALECIKTQLKLPEVSITTLGDSCTFRLVNVSQHRETGQKWLSPHFFVRGGHKMCLAVYPNGLSSGKNTHLSLKLLLLFDDQLEWPITLPSHLGIRVELLIESEGLFEETESVFEEDPITATRAPSSSSHHPEFTWKPRGDRRSSSSSPSPKSPLAKNSLSFDKRYSFNRRTTAPSLVRRASFNEKSSRKSTNSEESQQRLSRILPPWCRQPTQPTISERRKDSESESVKSNGEDKQVPSTEVRTSKSREQSGEIKTTSTLDRTDETTESKSSSRGLKKDTTIPVTSTYDMSTGDGVDGATVFSMERFATHEQIDKYTQEYNSLVFQITLCLV